MLEYVLPLLIGGGVVVVVLMAGRPMRFDEDERPGVVLSFPRGSGRNRGEGSGDGGGGDGGD
jgi:hypothetical protein